MNDLPQSAVAQLYPVLAIIVLVATAFALVMVGLWRGFRWLKRQIEETAQAMLAPIARDVTEVKASARKAHRRISRIRQELALPQDHMDEYETQE